MAESKVDVRTIICTNCGYEWTPRVLNPKKCPKCQKWMPTPRYRMRFDPYDEQGRMKRGAPKSGVKGCPADGDVVMLPLEYRWENYWTLVDDSVPEEELEADQKTRDAFMVKARAAEAERAKMLRSARVPLR